MVLFSLLKWSPNNSKNHQLLIPAAQQLLNLKSHQACHSPIAQPLPSSVVSVWRIRRLGGLGRKGFIFQWTILLMVQKSRRHLLSMKTYETWGYNDSFHINWCSSVAYLPSTVSTFDIAHKAWVDLTSSLGSEYERILDSIGGKIC